MTTASTGPGNSWELEVIDATTNPPVVQLRSWTDDYLHRPDSPYGVTTWPSGYGNRWEIFDVDPESDPGPDSDPLPCGQTVELRSEWKGDYLHRLDAAHGVTTGPSGAASRWVFECQQDGTFLLRSEWRGEYLHRPNSPSGVTTWPNGIGNVWELELVGGGTSPLARVQLRSWKGDYLHRPNSAQGVTTWPYGIGNVWEIVPSTADPS